VPIYMQIVQQVRRLVSSGELAAGEELPSIRNLAERLVVNPNTVARAYRELEIAGIVSSSRGLGTFVTDQDRATAHSERRALMLERIEALALESRQLGITFGEILELMHENEAAFQAENETQEEIGLGLEVKNG